MQAKETKLQEIIEGTIQYLIPLFQRPYSWKKSEWQVLWDDLMELYSFEDPRPHFMGAIVTALTPSIPEGVTKYLLIDGQQRLTTVFILLAALRDRAYLSEQELGDEINNTILVNPYKKGSDYYKLQPTQSDRNAFNSMVKKESCSDMNNGIIDCYNFFEKKIRQTSVDIQKIKNLICSRISLVSVVLSPEDDPYLVFESLNAKGRSLTQADLIRNYFFMQINNDEQESIYAQYWQPMQELLGETLTEFIRHYLTKNGSDIKQNQVYFELKNRINKNHALSELKDLSNFSKYYAKFLNPEQEENKQIRKYFERINRLDVATVYPFLLNCYHDYQQKVFSNTELLEILKITENFILRRFICDVPTRGLNKIFARLYGQVGKDGILISEGFIERLKLILQGHDYPEDVELKEKLMNINLYVGNRSDKARLILESIEEHFGHKEQVDFQELSIEHIMPQKLNDWWKHHLGEDWEITHNLLIHSLGNLTLTAYNSDLSNHDFDSKRNYFMDSHIELNKYFRNQSSWRREDIEQRTKILSDRILEIWSYFGDKTMKITAPDSITGKKPRKLQILGESYPVKTWRDVLEITLNIIADFEPEGFREFVEQYPKLIGRDPKVFRTPKPLKNGLFVEVNLSAEYINKFCLKAWEKIDLERERWRVETE